MTITDTPRTDAARERYYDGRTSDWVHYSTCRMIERELNASQAEVERLNNTLENTRISRDTMIEDRNLLDQELAASTAEVERLREDNQKLRARLNYVQGCDCDNYLHPYCNKLTK